MSLWESYRLRLRRKRLLLRAVRKRRELEPVANRTGRIRPADVLLFGTFRNEAFRLPHFLAHYRALGVDHFLLVDNDSTDGGSDLLRGEPDVSLWRSSSSYRKARFGMDWMNWLLLRHGRGHWCLTVDIDELLVYPFCDTRPLAALTGWLEESGVRAFGAMILDLYPKGSVQDLRLAPGDDPISALGWFDTGNYRMERNPEYQNLWIQGGPRERAFFAETPRRAPALNKIPLVKWQRRYAYVSSTHSLLPRGLNLVYDQWGGEKASGALLHTKFLPTLAEQAAREVARGEHYAGAAEYRAYHEGLGKGAGLWCKWSERYIGWRQLEILGLMSKGNWA